MAIDVRCAGLPDAHAMASIINDIIAIGGSTAHRQLFDDGGIAESFISPERGISCFVAVDGTGIIGFQALEWSDPDWPGQDRLPVDWAFISTYVNPKFRGQGAGRLLFEMMAAAATVAGVGTIDATIRKENTLGLAYYNAIGFTEYRRSGGAISKKYSPG